MPNKVKALVREVTFLDGLLLVYAEWLRDWRLCRFSFDQVPFFTFLARLHCRREKDMVCLLFVSLVRLLLFLRACIAGEKDMEVSKAPRQRVYGKKQQRGYSPGCLFIPATSFQVMLPKQMPFCQPLPKGNRSWRDPP